MVKAVIFDFDGTLIDSEAIIFSACQKYLAATYHYQLSKENYCRFVGTEAHFFNQFLLEELQTEVDFSAFDQNITEAQAREYPKAQLREEAQKLISLCDAKKIPMAIVSNSPWVELKLFFQHQTALQEKFRAIVTIDDVVQGKPDPAGYQLALKKLNCPAHQAVAIEDSPIGAQAALNGHLKTYLYPNQFTEKLIFPPEARQLSRLQL